MMEVEVGLFYFDVAVLVVLVLLAMVYTYYQIGTTGVLKDKYKFGLFGVFSFILVGFMTLGYIIFVYVTSYSYMVPIPLTGNENMVDLAHGFFTVVVAAAVGIALTVFAVMKYSYFGKKKIGGL